MITRPMLAGKVSRVEALTYPVLVSPKLDGIRCLCNGLNVLSRAFKPIPNAYITSCLTGRVEPELWMDGELMLRDTSASFQNVTSAVMSRDGSPDFIYHVFDLVLDASTPYVARLKMMEFWLKRQPTRIQKRIQIVKHRLVTSPEELTNVEGQYLQDGYEGLMVRSMDGPYKNGRSTEREGYLLKLKRFVDAEGEVIGFEEAQTNLNAPERDATGAVQRSSAKAGKIAKGTLGAFVVRVDFDGPNDEDLTFRIGTGIGLTAQLRQEIWNNQAKYLGKTLKFRYQEQGTKDAPRIPSFQGFRDPIDL